uniref:Uncharacterized protein n=1 Tax=Opuntia streptacantha TaxID=393608 RepID=A0A7C9ANS2_OPUST
MSSTSKAQHQRNEELSPTLFLYDYPKDCLACQREKCSTSTASYQRQTQLRKSSSSLLLCCQLCIQTHILVSHQVRASQILQQLEHLLCFPIDKMIFQSNTQIIHVS